MRIKLKKPREFFDRVMKNEKASLRQLSKQLGINYSNLKHYRRGDRTIPTEIFSKFSNINKLSAIEKLDDNWGAVKAGKISAEKNDMKKRMSNVRSYRKIVEIKIKINEFFCEFYGALLGDGCISKFKDYEGKMRWIIQLSGNKTLDSEYWKYLQNGLREEYGMYSYYYEYKNRNVCVLVIKNKNFSLNLNKDFGFPIGVKYKNLRISGKLMELDWIFKRMVVRGLFDTDGSIYAKKNEDYRYPIISISSKSSKFLNQIKNLLRGEGYPAYVFGSNVAVRGIKVVDRWFDDIGSSNRRNLDKYKYLKNNKCLPPNIAGL